MDEATPDDAERGVGDDPLLDLGGGLLRADEDHAERAAAFGDVEQRLRAIGSGGLELADQSEIRGRKDETLGRGPGPGA